MRKSVNVSDVEQFLTTVRDIGNQSLVYLMKWLYRKPTKTEQDLVEMATEAEQLRKGFGNVSKALLQRLRVKDLKIVADRYGWTLLMQATSGRL
ncbi:unnamed protein product [Peronospora farinosa]|uniref:Uncharacterized protein n=1 Tax=Peronospora farinosa TaxID=134698 RepID=A0AAV0SNP1_9STRA|nr:unnamed protein product [Peronospora farinosa]CAI5704569.1 unnamed protein product [Peronospora farinosa]